MAPDLMEGMTLVAAPAVGELLKLIDHMLHIFRLLKGGLADLALDLFGQLRRKCPGR